MVILQEATDPAVVEQIAQESALPHFASREGYSVAFLSKSLPAFYKWHEVRGIRSPFLEVQLPDTTPRIFGVHLTALLVNRLERRRAHEIESLLKIVGDSAAHLLIGDFNTVMGKDDTQIKKMPLWLRLLIMSNGGIHPRALRVLLDAGYIDVFRHLHTSDTGFTLPTPTPNTRLDYAFLPSEHISRVSRCQVINTPDAVNIASDHYPLILEIV